MRTCTLTYDLNSIESDNEAWDQLIIELNNADFICRNYFPDTTLMCKIDDENIKNALTETYFAFMGCVNMVKKQGINIQVEKLLISYQNTLLYQTQDMMNFRITTV